MALASPAAAAITSCQRRIQGVDDTPAAPWNLHGSCVHPHHPGTLSSLLPTLNPSHERKKALLYLGLWGHQTTLLAIGRLYRLITVLAVFFLPPLMAALFPVLCQERTSSHGPSSLTGTYHPLEFRSAEGHSVRNQSLSCAAFPM